MEPSPYDTTYNLDFAYRRFSSDVYSASLVELLEANEIPYDLISEPQNAGSVFLGSSAIPGVIVMIQEADALRVQGLEKEAIPQAQKANQEILIEQPVPGQWIVIGYIFALLGAPIAMIAGIHLFSSRKRAADLTSQYAYDADARTHGRYIFWFALFIFIFSLYRLMTGGKMSFLETFSFIVWQLHKAF